MPNLSKSLSSASWALSAFGVQQAANLLSPEGPAKAGAAFYSVTDAVRQEFSANPILYAIDQLGDGVQRGLADLFWDVLQLKPLNPQWLGSEGGRFFRAWAAAAEALTPAENLEGTWHQLKNTYTVIRLVNRATATLNLPSGPVNLRAAVDRAYALGGEYEALWVVEGLGEEYGKRNWQTTLAPRGLLSRGQGLELPEKSLLMMHAGLGIAFARRIIGALTPYSPVSQIVAALQAFLEIVEANVRPGYEGPALESLGLVTRTWYPQMVAHLDRCLWKLDIAALEYFWHGVGRATYFTPQYLLPGATAFQGVAAIAPHRLALLNGTAGAAWAFTLVNLRQPGVILNLVRNHGAALSADDAFSEGVASTVMMALEMIPGDPYATELCRYQPPTDAGQVAELWDRLVHQPCRRAIDRYFPVLKRNHRLREIFRYQDLDRLSASLEGRG
jgi:hypothetical protein